MLESRDLRPSCFSPPVDALSVPDNGGFRNICKSSLTLMVSPPSRSRLAKLTDGGGKGSLASLPNVPPPLPGPDLGTTRSIVTSPIRVTNGSILQLTSPPQLAAVFSHRGQPSVDIMGWLQGLKFSSQCVGWLHCL